MREEQERNQKQNIKTYNVQTTKVIFYAALTIINIFIYFFKIFAFGEYQ